MAYPRRVHRDLTSIRPPQPIGAALRKLARWAVASSLGAAAGCGDSFDDWPPVSCEQISNLLQGASLVPGVEFVGLYRDFNNVLVPSGQVSIGVSTLGSWGEKCAMADDQEACADELEAASGVREACRTDKHCGVFAVITKRGEVSFVETRSQLVDMFGRVDTLAEALAVSAWDGKTIQCGSGLDDREPGTRFSLEGNTYRFATQYDDCGYNLKRESWEVSRNGATSDTQVEVLGETKCSVGRRPAGLHPAERRFSAGTLAAFFAEHAHLEAASVYAFERLARELTSFGAPTGLIASAASSALDEVRHARAIGFLARRFGGEAYAVRLSKLQARSLFEVAYENAVEGCIQETYGALIAHHQAALATDRMLADCMRVIAQDETRHAQLAWQIAAWAEPRLSDSQREQIRCGQQTALLALAASQRQAGLPPAAARLLGLPEPAVAQQLVQQLSRMLG